MARIALTGASGRIGSALRPRLRAAGHDLVLCDVAPLPAEVPAAPGERVVVADVSDVDAHVAAFAGADLVVHLGGYPDERSWPEVLAVNIDGTQSVCEAARLAGVGRLLLASSVHAAGYVGVDDAGAGMPLPDPDTFYGVSKAAVEALGALYAGRFGMTVVSARIMTFAEAPSGPRSLQSWCSPDDMTRLVLAVLTTGATGHHVVWGVSSNTRRRVDLEPGRAIGFEPLDDAEEFAEAVAGLEGGVAPDRLGGPFALPGYVLGEPHGRPPSSGSPSSA